MPRFLAPNARAGDPEPDEEGRLSGRGYLNRPPRPVSAIPDRPETVARIAEAARMCDEPEALEHAEWKRHIKSRATQTAAQRRTLEEIARDRDRRLLSQEERIVKAQTQAQTARRDVKREMWVLEQMRAQGKSPEKIEKRLQNLEQIVYLGRAA
jgi:hypothetical protein